MKLTVNACTDIQETEVIIHCNNVDHSVQRLIYAVRSADAKMIGRIDTASYQVALSCVLYFESVDRKLFMYTENNVYETDKRLSQLEQELRGHGFFRASRTILVHLRRVRSIRPEIGARLLLTMDNGEEIIVSRQYAGAVFPAPLRDAMRLLMVLGCTPKRSAICARVIASTYFSRITSTCSSGSAYIASTKCLHF